MRIYASNNYFDLLTEWFYPVFLSGMAPIDQGSQ